MSRYSRDREHQAVIQKRVRAAGARLVFCDMTFEDTPEGDLAFGIMGTFADYERSVIRHRTVTGRHRRAQEGIQVSRSMSPMGYHIVAKKDVLSGAYPPDTLGTYVLIEEEARWVRGMFERYAAGMSTRAICQWLQSENVSTRRGGRFWRPRNITWILQNPVYKGTPVFGKRKPKHDESRLERGFRRTFSQQVRPEAEWVYLNAPAIVSEDLWDECQRRMQEGKAVFGGPPDRKYMLTGLLKCPECGNNMRLQRRSDGHGRSKYLCKQAYRSSCPDGHTCDATTYPATAAEGATLNAIHTFATAPDQVEAAVAALNNSPRLSETQDRRKRLEEQLAALLRKEQATLDGQIGAIEAGLDPTLYVQRLKEMAEQRRTVEAALAACERDAPPKIDAKDTAARVCRLLENVREALEAPELTPAEKHGAIARIVQEITPTANGDTVAYRLRLRPFTDGVSVAYITEFYEEQVEDGEDPS